MKNYMLVMERKRNKRLFLLPSKDTSGSELQALDPPHHMFFFSAEAAESSSEESPTWFRIWTQDSAIYAVT